MVLSLDKAYLRNSAIGFDQFQDNSASQNMQKILAFFLVLCERICTEGTTTSSMDCCVFLEWIKSANTTKYVGIRLHLFANRKGKTNAQSILVRMLSENKDFATKNSRQFVKTTMPWDSWRSITNYHEWAAQVCDPYSKHHRATSALDDNKFFLPTHAAHPLNVFSLQANTFTIKGACALQNDRSNYKEGTSFKFPDCNRIYRMFPSDLNLDKFFHKYLPDYFFTRVKHPDAISYPSESTPAGERVFVMYVGDHLEREKYVHFLDELSIEKNDLEDTWTFNINDKSKVTEKIQADYNCYRTNDATVEVGASTAGENFLTVTSKMDNMVFQSNSLTADSAKTISPLIETQLTNKHSLSDLDILRLQGQHRRKYVTDRRKFQLDMVESFCERVWDDVHADVSEPARMMLLWKSNTRDSSLLNRKFKKVDPSMSVFANRAIRILNFYDTSLFVSAQHKTLFLLNHSKYDAYREQPNLHFNQVYTGEGATSKSFLFEKMEEMSVPNTVQTLTYQTTRADAIDGDRNDTICVFNEAPPGMFITSKNVDNTQESMFKEKLTSMVVKVKEFWRDEATGERKNRVAKSQAIGVVMGATNDDPSTCSEAMGTRFYWGSFEKYSEGRSIQECMRGDRELQDCEAARHDKAQWIEYFREEQMRMWLVFKFIFMEILHAPTLKAADIVYAEVTDTLKKRFKVNIPPRTKERYEILCTIYTIINALETVFNIEGGLHSGTPFHPVQILDIEPLLYCSEEIAVFALTQISEEIVNPNEFKVLKAIWELHKKSGEYREEVHVTDDGKRMTTPDYNYIRLNNGKRLLTEIINAIPPTAGRMSRHNIKGILNDWNDRCIDCPIYQKAAQMMQNHRKFNDLYPEPMDGNSEKKITLIREERSTLIHIHQFRLVRKNRYLNIIKEALRSLEHKYADPNRKYLMGSSIREMAVVKYPNLLDTITLGKKESNVISLANPLFKNKSNRILSTQTNFSDRQLRKRDFIKCDLTTHGAIHHASILDKDIEYAKAYMEKYGNFGVESSTIDYPVTLIAPTEELEELTVEESSSDEEDFDAMVEPMLTHINKRARFE